MKYIFCFLIMAVCGTAGAQQLSEAEIRSAKTAFTAAAEELQTPSMILADGKEITIADSDPDAGLALLRAETTVLLFSQKERGFINRWGMPYSDGALALAPGGTRISYSTKAGAQIFDGENKGLFIPEVKILGFISANEVVATNQDGKYFTWNISEGKKIAKLPGAAFQGLSPDRKKILLTDSKKTYVFDIARNDVQFKFDNGGKGWPFWASNDVLSYGQGESLIDISTNAAYPAEGLQDPGRRSNRVYHGGNILAFKHGDERFTFYDVTLKQWLSEKPSYLPAGTFAIDYVVFTNPPAVLGFGSAGNVYYSHHDSASSSAVLIMPNAATVPLLWHQGSSSSEKIAKKKKDMEEYLAAKAIAKQRAIAKFGKDCADKFQFLIERNIDSGMTVELRNVKYIFGGVDCKNDLVRLYGVGSSKDWGIREVDISGKDNYENIIFTPFPLTVCEQCGGYGFIARRVATETRTELPQGYFSGIRTTKVTTGTSEIKSTCNYCSGRGFK